jgi:hypothetical protein
LPRLCDESLGATVTGRSVLEYLLFAAAAAFGAALTLPRALSYAFWQDEVASAEIIVESTPVDVAREVAVGESTPPAWYGLAWALHRLGLPVEHVRLASVVFTAALLVLVVVYARRLLPLWAAALAAFLAGAGWQVVRHGWELRAYALLMLATVLLALLLERAVASATKGRLALLAGVVALGALTHYFFLFSLAASLLWLFTSPLARGARRRCAVAVGVGLTPFALWLPAFAEQYDHQRFSWIGPFDAAAVVELYYDLFARVPDVPDLVVGLGVLAVVVGGCVVLARRSEQGRHCALLAVVPVVLAALAWLGGANIFLPRNLLGVAPFAAIAVAAAVSALPRSAASGAALLVAALSATLLVRHGPASPPDYERIASVLVDQGWSPTSPIAVVGPLYGTRGPLRWYLPARSDLEVGSRRDRGCRTIFLVSWGGRGAEERLLTFGSRMDLVGGATVARLDGAGVLAAVPERAHLLGTAGAAESCLRLGPR